MKKYIPVYRSADKICIGFVGKSNYLELEFNQKNNNLIIDLIKNGVPKSCLNQAFYKIIKEKEFLENNIQSTTNRGDLFLNYITKSQIDEGYKKKKVLVFGAGAGGSTLIYLLAQFGFKEITIIDFDKVELSDVNRVTVFDKSHIGEQKIIALKQKIKENFNCDIKTINIKTFEKGIIYDIINESSPSIVVKACDPRGLFLSNLNKVCFELKVPYIMMAYSYELIKVGPLFIPSITSCCESISSDSVQRYGDHYRIESFERLGEGFLFHPSISFNINILASLVFKEILFFLLGEYTYCQTIGRQIMYNPLNLKLYKQIIKCEDDCEVCGD